MTEPSKEEPTRLQEDQSEPADEPDRIYEQEFEKRFVDSETGYPNVTLGTDHVFALEVWDNDTGEQLVEESLVDHVELIRGTLVIEVSSNEPLPP